MNAAQRVVIVALVLAALAAGFYLGHDGLEAEAKLVWYEARRRRGIISDASTPTTLKSSTTMTAGGLSRRASRKRAGILLH